MEVYSFKLPDLGEGTVESEVTTWYVAVGDVVAEDQVVADVQTDKAVVEVTAPVAGRVLALGCDAGEVLAVGEELVRFEVGDGASADGAGEAAGAAAHPVASTESQLAPSLAPADGVGQPSRPAPRGDPVFGKVLASPSLRKRAREAGIDLAAVPGSGPRGRISHRDFERFLADSGAQKPAAEGDDEFDAVRLSATRRAIARKMLESKRSIPHYTYIEEVDVTELEALRGHLNSTRAVEQPKLTLLPFLVVALVRVLPDFPHCNARFDEEAGVLEQYRAVHIGMATMTDAGLMVPVVRHCERLDLWSAAAALAEAATAAREGRAAPGQLSGSTITITSLGALGGLATTPIINAPETAIVGVNKMQERPVIHNGSIVARRMMNLSASFDHRIVDGYDGARLVQALKALLEHPGAIFV